MGKIVVTAGNLQEMEQFYTAGADEVVFALDGYALSALPTMKLEELRAVSRFSLLMNRLIFQNELNDLKNVLKQLSLMNIEYIYFADPCFILYADEFHMIDKLIYRPETLVTNTLDALWWKNIGIYGISISPLLTKAEVVQITKQILNCELTIHGHLLMSVSKRLLLSAYKKYSGLKHEVRYNQNLYLIEEKRPDGLMPTYEDGHSMMIYTDFVQESFLSLIDFESCGVERFFIDSTFSDVEAIVDAIQSYRNILCGNNVKRIEQEYKGKYSELSLSTGYYGQKTIK